jgi:hypothetical protein
MKKLFIIGTILCLGFLSAVAQELEKPRPQPDADGRIITDRKGFDLQWPGSEVTSELVIPKKGSKVYMLGVDEPLDWKVKKGKLTVSIPQELQPAENRSCK